MTPMPAGDAPARGSQLPLYDAPNGTLHLEVLCRGETVWLTQKRMAELYNVDRTVVTKHLINIIFESGELEENSVSAILHILLMTIKFIKHVSII